MKAGLKLSKLDASIDNEEWYTTSEYFASDPPMMFVRSYNNESIESLTMVFLHEGKLFCFHISMYESVNETFWNYFERVG